MVAGRRSLLGGMASWGWRDGPLAGTGGGDITFVPDGLNFVPLVGSKVLLFERDSIATGRTSA